MKSLGFGVVVAIALAAGFATGLSFIQETVAQAYGNDAARLDQQEGVNFYVRSAGDGN